MDPKIVAKCFLIITSDPKVEVCKISDDGDDVWFWTSDGDGEENYKDYNWDEHGLSEITMQKLAEIGVEPMWNDCEGFFNEGCLGWLMD